MGSCRVAVAVRSLLVDTLDEVPETEGVDLLFVEHGEVGTVQDRREREVGSPAQLLAEGREHLLDRIDDRVAVAEVIQEDDASAGLTDPHHLPHHHPVVRYRRDHVGGHHGVETVVREFHRRGVHALQADMREPEFPDPVPAPGQHARREVDPDHLAGSWVERQGQAGAHAHFEHALAPGEVQEADRMLAPVVEDLAEDVVVDSRVAGVDPFDFRRVHNTSKL